MLSHQRNDQKGCVTFQSQKKLTRMQTRWTMYHCQDCLPAAEPSAALSREAAFHLPGASARAQFLCHAASRRGSSPVPVAHHATTHYSAGTPGASVIAAQIPAVVAASSGLSFTSGSCFFLFHVQAHLTPEHNGLVGKSVQGTR